MAIHNFPIDNNCSEWAIVLGKVATDIKQFDFINSSKPNLSLF